MSARLYVEGGGNSRTLRAACRKAFSSFIEKAGAQGRMPHIVACGIRDSAATSLEAETGRPLSVDAVADRLAASVADVLGRRLVPAPDGLSPAVPGHPVP